MWMSSRYALPTGLAALLFWFLEPCRSQTVTITPSNISSELLPAATSPRYLLNGSEIVGLPSVRLAPLANAVATLTQQQFSVSEWQPSLPGSELTVSSQ